MSKFTLTAECEAEDANDATGKFIDLIPLMLVNGFQEADGVNLTITSEGAA